MLVVLEQAGRPQCAQPDPGRRPGSDLELLSMMVPSWSRWHPETRRERYFPCRSYEP